MSRTLYLEPCQYGVPQPTVFENELADVLESTFAAGIHDIDGVVDALNQSRVRPPQGGSWSREAFLALMQRLGR